MRKEELLALRWEQVDLDAGTIQLAPEDTKTEEARLIVLTDRSRSALRALPSRFGRQYVFVNPKTGTRWVDIRKSFNVQWQRPGSTASGSTISGGASSPGRAESAFRSQW